MVIQHDDGTFSAPILLNKPIVRMAFGIQLKPDSVRFSPKQYVSIP